MCCNIVPGIQSVYEWEGKVQSDAEVLMIVKTQKSIFDQMAAEVKANHPYDVPEIIGYDITCANSPYHQWVID